MRLDMPEARDPFDSASPMDIEKRKTADQLAKTKKTRENIRKFLEKNGAEWDETFDESEGRCPICGSEDLYFGDSDQDDNWRSDHYTCEDCGTHSKEYSEYHYTGTASDFDDVGDLVIQVQEEMGLIEE